jgi:hypothetical protein
MDCLSLAGQAGEAVKTMWTSDFGREPVLPFELFITVVVGDEECVGQRGFCFRCDDFRRVAALLYSLPDFRKRCVWLMTHRWITVHS